jgi:hypothetical protein
LCFLINNGALAINLSLDLPFRVGNGLLQTVA